MFFTTYLRLIFGLDVPFLRSLFVFSLSARVARTVICSSFVRHSFVIRSSFVRHLFVFCSSFVRHSFVFCSSFVRHSFVIRSSFVRHSFVIRSSFVRHSFISLFRYYTPSPWERAGVRIFCSSFVYLPVVLRLPVRLAPSFL